MGTLTKGFDGDSISASDSCAPWPTPPTATGSKRQTNHRTAGKRLKTLREHSSKSVLDTPAQGAQTSKQTAPLFMKHVREVLDAEAMQMADSSDSSARTAARLDRTNSFASTNSNESWRVSNRR